MKPDMMFTGDEGKPHYSSPFVKGLFDNVFSVHRPLFSLSERLWSPPTDAYETADSIVVKIEIAGISPDDMTITTDKNRLVVRGKRSEDVSVRKENYYVMEIHYGPFERVFDFPDDFELANISASYEHGFLNIVIPKTFKQQTETKITIEER